MGTSKSLLRIGLEGFARARRRWRSGSSVGFPREGEEAVEERRGLMALLAGGRGGDDETVMNGAGTRNV